jgi:FlaA1/EpsC-like NDP-sugar epimerase
MSLASKLTDWYFSKNALPYWVVLIIDCLICYLSGIFVFWLYYHGAVTLGNIVILSQTIGMYMCFNLIGFKVFHTYSGIIRYSSFVDLQRIGFAQLFSLTIAEIMHYIVYSWDLNFVRLEGRQIAAMYIVAFIGMVGFRILVKTIYDIMFSSDKGIRTMIYGVKDGGVGLAKNIRNEKPTRFQLKGFISHENDIKGRILLGEKVYAVNDHLKEFLKDLNIQAVLVSPLQTERFRNDQHLQNLLIDMGIHIYITEGTKEWKPGDDMTKVHLHEVEIADLLPREEIAVDMKAIGDMLENKTVMITGAAGSIGSEMVRQIAKFKPANMLLIDQAETPQHDIRLMMKKNYPGIPCETVVTSITHEVRMEELFKTYRPDYVFHAAAYKHVPMMEDNPEEAVLNNICGTQIIADLSVKYGVKKFVMISTDKAVNPTNVMGCSKRICEIYCQSLNRNIEKSSSTSSPTQFVTTRFGNVLGSNGSVIPFFEKQIREGGPVTVTHPEIIRYFMLIPEACKLVLEAGTHGKGGEIFVFDMGKPVKIADLAKKMISLSGAKNIEIKYTGLRDGEKLYEELLSKDESTLPSFHEKIRIAKVQVYEYDKVKKDIEELKNIALTYDQMKTVAKMKQIVPEFISNNSKFHALDK